MQVLLTLILLYDIYFECVIYEIFKFPKLYTVKTFAINAPKKDVILSITDLNNESLSIKQSYFDIYSRLRHRPLRFMTNNSEQIKIKKFTQQCYCKNAKKNLHLYFHTNTKRMYQRKLLVYEENIYVCPTRHHKFNEMQRENIADTDSQLTEEKHDIVARDIESTDAEVWDNWSNWSACSVTCGQGRQVRWRHCLSENCIKGLKKAQLKSCRLEDCESKGFLSWFGIKS